VFQALAGKAMEGDFKSLKFGLANATKDVRYYMQLATESGLSAPMAAATMQTLLAAVNMGFGTPDHLVASLVEAQAKINGVVFPPHNNK